MDKKQKIKYLLQKYEDGINDRKPGWKFDICYEVKNKTFYMNIGELQYSLVRNKLTDPSDGVGDELAGKIAFWAQNK